MINVGIIGCGFVGGALKDWLEHNNPECKLFISDPPKGYNDDLNGIDIAFLQIHVPTEDDGTQDLTLMKELITNLPDVPVFVRTTILPGTSETLSRQTGHQVCYMPEFLSERTAIEDFRKQPMVFTGAEELLARIFVGKRFIVMSPLEAELTKYMHNVFGAYKVTYFNACREFCEQMRGGGYAGARSTPGCSFQATSTIPTLMCLVPTGNSAMEASASRKMSMLLPS
jgi:UDPglucose 6-dehydrogenase